MDVRMALVAHDAAKATMLSLASEYMDVLRTCRVCATRTTGKLLSERLALDVECLHSGPRGGDIQIAARIAGGLIDALIFLRDPLAAHPHQADVSALLRLSDLANVVCATNEATARVVLDALRCARTAGA
ncbi:methylglyoxal synthase [Luteibacter sp. 329MFSha]|uniref:methylglyoxal synthase n=1 Tax=Luteibacter sp. 329MFSha TaxID=1798239 RepID=UPI0008BCF8DF|nr:methylglyoxal synthase [Luteibacter sp. 329MFSha]SEV83458.1 methylglyoxal synthase [Luteibacter sp. 329MFSha]